MLKILERPGVTAKRHKSPLYRLSYAGITDTLAGWAKRTGIASATLYRRHITNGWPVHKTLTTPLITGAERARHARLHLHRCKIVEVDGILDSVAGHARRYQVNPYTVYKRLAYGCSPKTALTAPKGTRGAWLVWEDKLLLESLDRPSAWLAERLPRHSIDGVRQRRRLIRRQLQAARESAADDHT